MTYAVQPSPRPSFEPDIRITGELSVGLLWVAVILLAFAIALIVRSRGSNGE